MKHAISSIVLLAALSLTACIEPGEFVYGDYLPGCRPPDDPRPQEFYQFHEPTDGIYPFETVLDDPNNPFRNDLSGEVTRFQIQAGCAEPMAAFYSWASWLATVPTGEHQYFSALNLEEIYQQELVDPPESLDTVREMAVEAYTTVLEEFPDAASFDATGSLRFELVTPSYLAIIRLGGTPPAGWILVEGEGGVQRAVRQ